MILCNVEKLGTPGVRDVAVDGSEISHLTFDSAFAFPGLVNSHDHLEFNCYEQLGGGTYRDYVEWGHAIHSRHAATIAVVECVPRALRMKIGVAKNLLCGITCVAQHGPWPDIVESSVHFVDGIRVIHSPRLGRLRGMLIPDRRTVVAHVGEGVGPESQHEIDRFTALNVWRKKLVGVHAIAMRANQAQRFSAVVWCPVSNEFLFGRTAAIAELKHSTTILFGTDSTLTAPWNVWDHIRRARQLGVLSDQELIGALTSSAVRLWNIPRVSADIVVARKRHPDQHEAFFAINPEDILLVVKAGKIVLLDASLRGQLPVSSRLFEVAVNGTPKFTVDNYSEIAKLLRTELPSFPLPIM